MNWIHKAGLGFFLAGLTLLAACNQPFLYEKLSNIPGASWRSKDTLHFTLEIPEDTTAYYLIATIRHTSKYEFRNVWIKLGLKAPGQDSAVFTDFNLPLATAENWSGTGMNDVYERRVRLFKNPVRFAKKGTAVFTLQHIMREDPLNNVLQAGLRLEPVRR